MPVFSYLFFFPFSGVKIFLFKCYLQVFCSKHLSLYCTATSTLWLTKSAIGKVFNCMFTLILYIKLVRSSDILDYYYKCAMVLFCLNKYKYFVHIHVFLNAGLLLEMCVLLPRGVFVLFICFVLSFCAHH